MEFLRLIAMACVIATLFYYAAATLMALRFARRRTTPPGPLPAKPPGITVLKPLHGLSRTLADNLGSYLELSYPRVQYLFAVASAEDRAIEAPLALKTRYPSANIEIVVGEEPGCANHKVAKLIRMAEQASAETEAFVLSDADIVVEPDHLRRVAAELFERDDTGIVTCLYRGRAGDSLGSKLEALFVNTDFAPMVLLSEAIEPMRHALGATIAVKRKALDAIGGFLPLRNLLADDFYLGRMVADKGFGVRLSSSLVTIAPDEAAFSQFWNHQLRWARTYRTVRPASLATIVIHGPFWAILLALFCSFSAVSIATLAAVVLARYAMAATMITKVLDLPASFGDLWIVPLKDLVMTGIYFAGLAGNTVLWGGRRFKLIPGGAMRELG